MCKRRTFAQARPELVLLSATLGPARSSFVRSVDSAVEVAVDHTRLERWPSKVHWTKRIGDHDNFNCSKVIKIYSEREREITTIHTFELVTAPNIRIDVFRGIPFPLAFLVVMPLFPFVITLPLPRFNVAVASIWSVLPLLPPLLPPPPPPLRTVDGSPKHG